MANGVGAERQGYRMRAYALRIAASGLAPRWRDYAAYGGLALVALFAAFYGLGSYGILDGNEAIYVEAAREMALAHDWAVPTLDGLPYLEKPPLFMWLLAATLSIGPLEFAARTVSAGAALLLCLGMLRYSVLLGIERRGIAAAFVLATCAGIGLMARVALPDLLLTACFASGCLGFLVALRENSLGYLRWAAALLGAATMVKGALPIALFVLIAAACYGIEKPWRAAIRRFASDPLSLSLLFLPIGFWLVAIDASLPGAASYFIIDEHILRFLGTREPRDYYSGSAFYYLPRLFLFFFPWPGVLLFGWLAASKDATPRRRQLRRFLWLCVWIPFGFFSLSSAKANYYIVLCLPPMALLTADYLPGLLRERGRSALAMAVLLPTALFLVILALAARESGSGSAAFLAPLREGGALATIGAIAALAASALLFVTAGFGRLAIICLGAFVVPLSFQLQRLVVAADSQISARSLAAYVRGGYGDEAPIYLFEDFEAAGALPIYLGRTVPVIDSKSNDLYFGRRVLRSHPNLVGADEVLASGVPALIAVLKSRERDFARSRLSERAVEVAAIGRFRLYRLAREADRPLH